LGLVVHSPGPSLPRSIAPSNAVLAPGVLGAVDPRVAELGLSGYLDVSSLPVSLRQVENNVEQACSWVAATNKLLWEAMDMVSQVILHPIWG
jgi:hypothetical protein